MLDLVDMQCMWFAIEGGFSMMRSNQFGAALNKFHQISKHFQDIVDDQFDFHTYCLRKLTIRSYLNLLSLEDDLHNQKYYVRAIEGAVECYIKLHDDPILLKSQIELIHKKKQSSVAGKSKSRELVEKEQQKSTGLEYLQAADLLEEALKLLKPVMRLGKMSKKICDLAFQIFLRKGIHIFPSIHPHRHRKCWNLLISYNVACVECPLLAYKVVYATKKLHSNDPLTATMEESLRKMLKEVNTNSIPELAQKLIGDVEESMKQLNIREP